MDFSFGQPSPLVFFDLPMDLFGDSQLPMNNPCNPIIEDYGAFLIREHFRKDTFSEELDGQDYV